jgi:EAL domain-containing protein (putative c-di-GMP-specific phosphodiesterase class I)
VAVNVSAAQFEQPDFSRRVAALLTKTGLSPSMLTIELTESVLMRDLARAQDHLSKLRNLGVRVALDDFGTGYSSLSYLTTLPADSIKLDRSFVQREFSNPTGILASLVQMAHGIGLRVVAEGVETRVQFQRLISMDCDLLQGYYFSEPLPCSAVPAYLEAHSGKRHESAELTLSQLTP